VCVINIQYTKHTGITIPVAIPTTLILIPHLMLYKCILPLILDELFGDVAQVYGSLIHAYPTCTIELSKMKPGIRVSWTFHI